MGSSTAKTSSYQVSMGPRTFLATVILLPDCSSRICMGCNSSPVSPINAPILAYRGHKEVSREAGIGIKA
jgi:hypothetical protein